MQVRPGFRALQLAVIDAAGDATPQKAVGEDSGQVTPAVQATTHLGGPRRCPLFLAQREQYYFSISVQIDNGAGLRRPLIVARAAARPPASDLRVTNRVKPEVRQHLLARGQEAQENQNAGA